MVHSTVSPVFSVKKVSNQTRNTLNLFSQCSGNVYIAVECGIQSHTVIPILVREHVDVVDRFDVALYLYQLIQFG